MPEFFKKLSFRKKILSSYVLFIMIACVLIVIYCMKSIDAAESDSYAYMRQFSEQISMNTDLIVSNMDRVRFVHLIDDKVKKIIRRSEDEKSIAEQLEEHDYIERALNHMTNMNQYVLRATIINEYGDLYSNVETDNGAYLEKMKVIDSAQDWTDKHKVYYTGAYEEQIYRIDYELVTSISKIYDIDRDSSIGTLYIDLNFSKIRELLNQFTESGKTGAKLLVFDSNQNVLYDSEGKEKEFWDQHDAADTEKIKNYLSGENGKGYPLPVRGEKCVAAAERNETTGWYVLARMPLKEIYHSGIRNMLGILSAMLVLLLAAVLLVIYLADQISYPVTVLTDAMGQVDEGTVALIDENKYFWQDEMGQLLNSYNIMGRRINESIEKIYVYQLNQKQTELKMLQFQINPHFLYNTLNTVSSIAALEDINEIVKIADNLSSMFQYNIKGDDIVKVSNEIQHVKNYLEIQEIRFPGKYKFSYEISPGIHHRKMLKFLIQPLVENSLQHAFLKMKEVNRICIRSMVDEQQNLYFFIRDNGIGMSQNQVERLNRELADTNTRTLVNRVDKGIGLRNVNARIKNFYGKDYGIQVKSEEGQYTEIIIHICLLENAAQGESDDESFNCG